MKLETGAALSSEGPEHDRVYMTHDIHRPWWYFWGPRAVTVEMTPGQAKTLCVGLGGAIKHLEIKRRRTIVTL